MTEKRAAPEAIIIARGVEVVMTIAETKIQDAQNITSVFRHILVATDFSNASRRALCDALLLAADNDAQLSVVHVSQSDWRYEMVASPPEIDLELIDARQRLQAFIDDLGSERKIEATLVKHGPVAQAVIAVVADMGADLLVIGTRGRAGLSKLALGSVAEELLRIAPCPVMTVGPKADIAATTHGHGFHTILFASDFGKGSAKALPLALTLAKSHQAKLILLHMIAPMPATSSSLSAYAPASSAADEVEEWEGSSRKRALQRLKECLPAEVGLEQEPEYVVGTDFLPEGVLMTASKFKVDLIVMGANRTAAARVAAHIPWTAVHEVVRNAPCPVLTVAG